MDSSISFGIAQSPSGAGCIVPPASAWPSNMIWMKALRSSDSASARRTSRLSKGGGARIDDDVGGDVERRDHADGVRRLLLDVLDQRDRDLGREGDVELAGDKGKDRGRAIGDDRVFDAVEIGQALLPVVGVLGQLDQFIGLELDELERAGADRMGAHLGRRNVAGIDRRIAGGEQREQRGLRPLQLEGGLEVAIGRHVVDLIVPGLARVLAELLLRLAHQHLEGAFDVGRGERLAVMPFDALAQLEGQRLLVVAPGPALGKLGADIVHAVLGDVLVVDDEIVEDRHEGDVERIARAFMDRCAAGAVAVVHAQDTARFRLVGGLCDG